MDRIYASGASGTAPSAPASPSSGYPTAGNPSTGTPATKPGPYWYHMIMEELMAIITAGGIPPEPGTLNQVKQALDALYMSSGSALGKGYMLVRDERASGTTGGASAVGTQTRTLNTVSANTISGASLASNQITLPAGTYRVRAKAPTFSVNNTQAWLYNVTDASTPIRGTSENGQPSNASDPMTISSFVEGRFTIAGSKVFELRQYCNEVNLIGLGAPVSQGTEVYSTVEIIKE